MIPGYDRAPISYAAARLNLSAAIHRSKSFRNQFTITTDLNNGGALWVV